MCTSTHAQRSSNVSAVLQGWRAVKVCCCCPENIYLGTCKIQLSAGCVGHVLLHFSLSLSLLVCVSVSMRECVCVSTQAVISILRRRDEQRRQLKTISSGWLNPRLWTLITSQPRLTVIIARQHEIWKHTEDELPAAYESWSASLSCAAWRDCH